jgi:soluble cytochrome b562
MTKEELYDDNQNMFKKIDIQHKQLIISNNVVNELKKEIKEKDEKIIFLEKEVYFYKEKNNELLEQIDNFKNLENSIDIKNTEEYKSVLTINSIYFAEMKKMEKELEKIRSIKSEINDTYIFNHLKEKNGRREC